MATTLTAYAPAVRFERQSATEMGVYDGSDRKVGHVSIIRGFGHYVGCRGAAHFGISAVIALTGGNTMDAIADALRNGGIRNGRDDRN